MGDDDDDDDPAQFILVRWIYDGSCHGEIPGNGGGDQSIVEEERDGRSRHGLYDASWQRQQSVFVGF